MKKTKFEKNVKNITCKPDTVMQQFRWDEEQLQISEAGRKQNQSIWNALAHNLE